MLQYYCWFESQLSYLRKRFLNANLTKFQKIYLIYACTLSCSIFSILIRNNVPIFFIFKYAIQLATLKHSHRKWKNFSSSATNWKIFVQDIFYAHILPSVLIKKLSVAQKILCINKINCFTSYVTEENYCIRLKKTRFCDNKKSYFTQKKTFMST